MRNDTLISAKDFYTTLGVPQALFNVWCQRGFVVPERVEPGKRKKLFFTYNELVWGMIFVLFVQQLGVDRAKTTNSWRGQVLDALENGLELIALSFGHGLQAVGRNVRGPYLQMMKMKRDSFRGFNPNDIMGMIQKSPGTVAINLKKVMEYLDKVLQHEE